MLSPEEKNYIEEFKRRLKESERIQKLENFCDQRLGVGSPIKVEETLEKEGDYESDFNCSTSMGNQQKFRYSNNKRVPETYVWNELEKALEERENYKRKLDNYLHNEEKFYKSEDVQELGNFETSDKKKSRIFVPTISLYDAHKKCKTAINKTPENKLKNQQIYGKNNPISYSNKISENSNCLGFACSKRNTYCGNCQKLNLVKNSNLPKDRIKSMTKNEVLKIVKAKSKENPKEFLNRVLIHSRSCNVFYEEMKRFIEKY